MCDLNSSVDNNVILSDFLFPNRKLNNDIIKVLIFSKNI
jgi:hypothetical protein